jgi:hypothetical protein
MPLNRTPQQLASELMGYANATVGKRVAYNGGYPGECLSLPKDFYKNITGREMPGAVNGYYWADSYYLYFDQSPPLPEFFDKVAYTPGANYPTGSMVFYAASHHIALWIKDNGNGSHTVLEQNADPDGSATHFSSRSNSRVTGLLVPKFVNGGRGGQGDDMPIPDQDNYYNRYLRMMNLIRGADISGRGFGRDEFRRNFVGRTDLQMEEAMADNAEANQAHGWMQTGYVATRDNWPAQIYGLQDTVKQLQVALNNANNKPPVEVVKTVEKIVNQCTVNLDTLPEEDAGFLVKFVAWLTKKKA